MYTEKKRPHTSSVVSSSL